MKKNQFRKLIDYLNEEFNISKTLLDVYICENAETIKSYFAGNLTQDQIYDTVGDPKSIEFEKFIKKYNELEGKEKASLRFRITEELVGIYIEKSKLGKKSGVKKLKAYKEAIRKIEKIRNKSKKGAVYEEFCTYFLRDMGMKAHRTKPSNDKGVDIKAYYKPCLPNRFSDYFMTDNIYVLAQTKFFDSKIDLSHLRKLVGDSIFLRFSELYYLDVTHNAVHLMFFSHEGFCKPAIEFAEKNKIIITDTNKMLNIISALDNTQAGAYLLGA